MTEISSLKSSEANAGTPTAARAGGAPGSTQAYQTSFISENVFRSVSHIVADKIRSLRAPGCGEKRVDVREDILCLLGSIVMACLWSVISADMS